MNSLTVTWDASPADKVTGFTVELWNLNGTNQRISDPNVREATITGLEAAKRYTVVVVTLDGNTESEPLENSFYTSKCGRCSSLYFHLRFAVFQPFLGDTVISIIFITMPLLGGILSHSGNMLCSRAMLFATGTVLRIYMFNDQNNGLNITTFFCHDIYSYFF